MFIERNLEFKLIISVSEADNTFKVQLVDILFSLGEYGDHGIIINSRSKLSKLSGKI